MSKFIEIRVCRNKTRANYTTKSNFKSYYLKKLIIVTCNEGTPAKKQTLSVQCLSSNQEVDVCCAIYIQ